LSHFTRHLSRTLVTLSKKNLQSVNLPLGSVSAFALLLFLLSVTSSLWAQDPARQSGQYRLMDDIRATFHRSDYRACLALVQELNSAPDLREDLKEEAEFIRACSAARLRDSDGEGLLRSYLQQYPSSGRVNKARFELADWYYRAKSYDKVIQQLASTDLEVLTGSQRHAARFYWGYSLFGQKKLKEALPLFNAIKLSDGEYAQAATYYAGFTEFTLEQNDAALADLRRLEKEASYQDVVPVLIAHTLSRQGNTDELLKYARSLEKKTSVQGLNDIRLLASEALYRQGRHGEALPGYTEYLKNGVAVEQGTAGVYYRAGHAAYLTGKYPEAAQWLKQVAGAKDSLGRHASYFLAITYLRQGQKQSALTAFQTAGSGNANDLITAECAYQSAKLLYDLMRADQAIDEMESFLSRYPGNSHAQEVRELLSGAYVNANNYRKAISHIETLSTRTPAVDKAYQKAALHYGFEFYNKGDMAGAGQWFTKSLANPLNGELVAEASAWYGEALAQQGNLTSAAQQYERVISNNAATPEVMLRARYGLGYARFNLRQYDKAQTSFRDFVNRSNRQDSRYAEVLARLGDCSYVQKSYNDAQQFYTKSFEAGPHSEDYARMQAGIVLGILRRQEDGIRLLNQVVEDFPSSVFWDEALFQKAQLEFEISQYDRANIDYTRLMREHPESRFTPFALVRRAAARFNMKDYKATADDYIRALRTYPGHPVCEDIILPLQEALGLAGRSSEFDGLLREFKERNPRAKGLESVEFETAKGYYFSQKYAEAIPALNNFISSYPDNGSIPEARYYRAESYYRQKDFTAALRSYYELENDLLFASANRVAARIAELEMKSGNLSRALPAYRRLASLAQTPKDKTNALSGQMECHFQSGAYDSALFFSNRILSEAGAGPVVAVRAQLVAGRAYQTMGETDKAKDAFISVINDSRDEPGAEAKFRLAEIQLAQKEYNACYETVVALNQDYGAYTEWVGKGFLVLAESFIESGEVFQATATLKSLDKFPLEDTRQKARQRLISLEALGKNDPTDSTDHD